MSGATIQTVEGPFVGRYSNRYDRHRMNRNLQREIATSICSALSEVDDPCFVEGRCSDEEGPRIVLSSEEQHLSAGNPGVNDLRKLSAMAECGRGDETVLDTHIRKAWKVKPGAVEVKWPALDTIVDTIAHETLPGTKLRAELHDVLVYDPGFFFKKHRDAQKAKGHVMTLSVTVECTAPSAEVEFFEGRRGKVGKPRWNATPAGAWAAWFCTQSHAVIPTTFGHRVAVIYNLYVVPETLNPAPLPSLLALRPGSGSHCRLLLEVPTECLEVVGTYLCSQEAIAAACTCKLFYEVVLGSDTKKLTYFFRQHALKICRYAQCGD